MARNTKSPAQKAHEARNKALKVEAGKRRRAAAAEGRKAFKANIVAMKNLGKTVRAARVEAHLQRNAEAALEAAQRRADRKVASNDNGKSAVAA